MPFHYIQSTDDLKHASTILAGRGLLALDLETEGLDPHRHKVVLLAVGDDREQLLVDCRRVSLEPLVPLLTGDVPKVTHNGAFDLAMLRSVGIRVENVLDTMLIEQVLENGIRRGRASLASLSEKYLGKALDKTEQKGFAAVGGGELSKAQLEYSLRDILATYHVLLEQMSAVVQKGLENTVRLECRAVPAFADMHYDGVFLDAQAWRELIDEARRSKEQYRSEIDKLFAGVVQVDLFGRVDINLESENEVRGALEKLLGRPVRSVDKSNLKRLGHPIGQAIIAYREASKIVSAYGESFLDFIHPVTGRIHADFMQVGAPTGRVACRDPNLQNIPRGSRFRKCFKAPEGYKMITADYSGCELRILAEVSGDPAFVNTFSRGGDLHSIVASEIFSRPVSKERNKELRDRAKAINFGLAYGMGAGGLAAQTGLPLDEAERLLKRYFRAYPKVRAYLEDSARIALSRGWVQTLAGRKLWLGVGERMEGSDLAAVRRIAKNMPIQGTNADMLKLAMAGIRRRFIDDNFDARIVNTVHDEVLVEANDSDAWDVAEIVRAEMVKAGERFISSVPIEVDVSVADHWVK